MIYLPFMSNLHLMLPLYTEQKEHDTVRIIKGTESSRNCKPQSSLKLFILETIALQGAQPSFILSWTYM